MATLTPNHLCNGLIRRSIELQNLYREAATQVSEPGLRTVLGEDAQSLDQVIAELQAQVRRQESEPATRGRPLLAARQQFDTFVLRNLPHDDDAWIRLLARRERNLMRAFERAIDHDDGEGFTCVLHRQLPRLQSIDLDMCSLAKAASH